MARRTPPQQYWAKLLRTTLESASAPAREPEPPAGAPDAVDDLVARVMADIERHESSAAAIRSRVRTMGANAGAALKAAVHDAAIHDPSCAAGQSPRPGAGVGPGRNLDVRR